MINFVVCCLASGVVGASVGALIAFAYCRRGFSYIEIHDDLGDLGKELIRAKSDGHTTFTIDLIDADCQVAIIDPRVNYLEKMINK